MRVTVLALATDDLARVHREGIRHPVLGGLLDAGSYVEVADLAAVPDPWAEVRARLAGGGENASLSLLAPRALAGAEHLLPALEEELGAGGAVAVLVAGPAEGPAPLAVLCGRTLPSLGPLPPCGAADLAGTLLRLAGGRTEEGRDLLEEPDDALDEAGEARLLERLRQLYGE